MDLRKVAEFLEGRRSAESLRILIRAESEVFGTGMQVGHASIALYGGHDDFRFVVEPAHVRAICQGFLSGVFTGWDASYLGNLLMLSRTFQPAGFSVERAVFTLADPVRNQPVSIEKAGRILSWIGKPALDPLGQAGFG
ncbi:hypothetical protein IIC65_00550 [Candidatus Sumerlaeota bacterium]|nr:hypothetical protein [Candidatus Sumerlaeota bacterium]